MKAFVVFIDDTCSPVAIDAFDIQKISTADWVAPHENRDKYTRIVTSNDSVNVAARFDDVLSVVRSAIDEARWSDIGGSTPIRRMDKKKDPD